MTKHIKLLLFIGLAWGQQSLKFININGQSVIIKKAQFGSLNPYNNFYLNGIKYQLEDVDLKKKVVKVKTVKKFKFFHECEEIPFDSIYSFRYIERYFNIIPVMIGGGIGHYFLSNPKADTLSFIFGTIPAYTFGLVLSFIPRYSEKLILGGSEWTIKIE